MRHIRRRGNPKALVIPQGDLASPPIPVEQMRKLHAENRGLKFVHAGVTATRNIGLVLRRPSVLAQAAESIGDYVVVRYHRPAIAQSAQILSRVEAEARQITK